MWVLIISLYNVPVCVAGLLKLYIVLYSQTSSNQPHWNARKINSLVNQGSWLKTKKNILSDIHWNWIPCWTRWWIRYLLYPEIHCTCLTLFFSRGPVFLSIFRRYSVPWSKQSHSEELAWLVVCQGFIPMTSHWADMCPANFQASFILPFKTLGFWDLPPPWSSKSHPEGGWYFLELQIVRLRCATL